MAGYYRNLKYEDTLQCTLYFSEDVQNQGQFEDLQKSMNVFIKNLSHEYIWHRDDFKLCLHILKEHSDLPCLTGTTCFGDNVEDEWFIVYLILEITKKYSNVVAQVEDNDGDFLLIEAANYLPSWANPESTENRVFLYKGKIHIINPTVVPCHSKISIQEAISTIINNYQKTIAPTDIQQAILQRIGNYPEKIETLCHRTNVSVPVELAALLYSKPSLISPIVTSYCNMDLIDMKHCKNYFNDNVTVKIKFTKYLYAMLLSSKSINLAGAKNIDDKKTQLGMKLAWGYQIIKKSPVKDEFNSLEYKKFINSLNKNGYFKNNLEGSKDYKELLAKANEYFLSTESSVTSHVNNIICNVQSTVEYNDLLETLKVTSSAEEDDDDDWLNVNPEHFNDFLSSKYSKDNTKCNETLKNKLSNFLHEKSDFEGIDKRDEDIFEDNNIEFDSEEFVKSLDKMLRFVSNECKLNDSDSDNEFEVLLDDMNNVDDELASKLNDVGDFSRRCDPKEIAKNLIQSLKEEDLSGPSSNILKSIGINKNDMLDSDDDDQ
ncbi:protein ecdysoneless homolog isoform X2 [Aricia agestis]|uniref:protein ecdysoneless homolog isoform X2 n=1 Tax=Aricia agestis TaxID=91739 RepID=UPI001C2050AB|nr:protein ecdysoneless homolog isoform X2 [Aricia agestis]